LKFPFWTDAKPDIKKLRFPLERKMRLRIDFKKKDAVFDSPDQVLFKSPALFLIPSVLQFQRRKGRRLRSPRSSPPRSSVLLLSFRRSGGGRGGEPWILVFGV
jgi:hypothetical protein